MNGEPRLSSRLTRHFFAGLFDLGFLNEAGTMSFTRLILGICAVFFSFGLLLLRIYAVKYANLGGPAASEAYQRAILADHAFLIAIPMWIVAFVTILTGHALFPDETDFRVLIPLPITRRLVFGAKLLALILFTGVFIMSADAALAPMFLLTSLSRWAEGAFILRAGAFGVASLLGSAFAVLVVIAIHGVLVLGAAGGRAPAVSAAVRSLMLCALMLSLPLMAQLPAQAKGFAEGSSWLYIAPPAWFAGLERWLLGDPRVHFVHLARIAIVGLMLVTIIAAGSYALLYRHFDRLMVRPGQDPGHRARRFRPAWMPRERSRPAFAAIRAFTLITLRRSVLHQGIVVVLSGIGIGLAANSLIGAGLSDWWRGGGLPSRHLVDAIVWAPFALMYVGARAVRIARVVPIEPRANWLFRMTEREAWRADQLGAVQYTVTMMGILIPAALWFPLQLLILGTAAFLVLMSTLLCGWVYVELLINDWRRIPFTCSYIPGKGFVPQTVLVGAVSFIAFTTAGAGLARLSVAGQTAAWCIDALLLAAALILRRRRINNWSETPFEFEDTLPTEMSPLKLSGD